MTPRPRRRIPSFIIAAALGLITLTGCGLQPSARVVKPVGPALTPNQSPAHAVAPALIAAPVASLVVRADDLAFVQQTIAVAAPGLYRVHFVNQDDIAHEVAFDDGAHLTAGPGESATALVNIPAAGTSFVSVLAANRDAGMVGQITVTE
jgi:plastocyanin